MAMNICEQCQCETKEEEKKISLVLFSEKTNDEIEFQISGFISFEKIKRKSIQILILTNNNFYNCQNGYCKLP
ncbi:hypothetical protein DERP_010515 [Dermatophagoides pteronyssinus]|uniref:Uncharacterized protein n=1 Tax=Dermatophagoides pteronyssinus TaxID=6956 RepID=A0ABQ8JFL0_DERPT|nr:hypothetical protein DERP_010515 [Dermatophagoides pteronyssinus]